MYGIIDYIIALLIDYTVLGEYRRNILSGLDIKGLKSSRFQNPMILNSTFARKTKKLSKH